MITQAFNGYELEALRRAQVGAREGKHGVVVVRFSLDELVDHLHCVDGPPDRSRFYEAWALMFEVAAERMRNLPPLPDPLPPALVEPERTERRQLRRRRVRRKK